MAFNLLGPLLGPSSSSGGGDGIVSSPALGNETTEEAIRDRAIAVIAALAPRALPPDPFRVVPDQNEADFFAAMEAAPASATRRYQVRFTGNEGPPEISNGDFYETVVTIIVLVAYAQNHRWGTDNARARDAAIKSDQRQIERAIGLGYQGRANFAPPYPDACWRSGDTKRISDRKRGVDYLQITQMMTFRCDVRG